MKITADEIRLHRENSIDTPVVSVIIGWIELQVIKASKGGMSSITIDVSVNNMRNKLEINHPLSPIEFETIVSEFEMVGFDVVFEYYADIITIEW